MSDFNLGTASGTVTLDVGPLRRGVGAAQSALAGLEPVVARQWWGLQNLGRSFALIGGFVAAGFGVAVKESMAWEQAMVGVQRTSGLSGAALAGLEKSLRDVASSTPISAQQIAKLAEEAGALGVTGAKGISEFARVAGTLIATTDLTEASVTDLGKTLNVLGVPTDQFERFASTLINVGRSTAATESEILNMARRLAGTGRQAGLTAAEVLGLSAATLSLGPRAEAGGSAVAKVFQRIASAIADGGNTLKNFAIIAGTTTAEFTKLFQVDPAQAFTDVITGLGGLRGGLVSTTKVLSDLGITERREIQALAALASGTKNQGSLQSDLAAILKFANDSWARNVAFTEVAQQRYGTAAAQIQILRNRISEMANTVGKMIVPVLRFVVDRIQDFVAGFMALPGPIRVVAAVLVGLIGAITLLAGGIILLIGRVVLAYQTLRTLQGVEAAVGQNATGAAAQIGILSGSLSGLAAAGRVGSASLASVNASLGSSFAGAGTAAATAETEVSTWAGSAAGASRAAGFLGENISRVGKVVGILGTIIAVGSVALTIFGNRHRAAAKATETHTQADLALVDAIREQAKGVSNAADEWVIQQSVLAGILPTLKDLKIEFATLNSVIQGTASVAQFDRMMKTIDSSTTITDKARKHLVTWMRDTRATFEESAKASGLVTNARKSMAEGDDAATTSEEKLKKAADDTRKQLEQSAQATIDYISAQLDQRAATFDLQDAQEKYNKALQDAKNPADIIRRAELKLEQARLDQQKAAEDVKDAEKDLANARKNQRKELAQDLRDQADAQASYRDSVQKVHDIEAELVKLRRGPSLQDLTDATLKLKNAQDALHDSQQKVADAQWQLNYLREEGASNRDIKNAEEALKDARLEVSNNTNDVNKSEKELNDLRSGADRKEKIVQLERDLAKARRDVVDAAAKEADAEQKVKDIRDAIAKDTAYKDAQRALVDAQLAYQDSIQKTKDAELELNKARTGGPARDLAKAELELEQAIYRSAQANAEARKQQMLMRGEWVDAGVEARLLADELGKLSDAAPTPDMRRRLQDYIATLKTARSAGRPPKDATDGGGGGGGAEPPAVTGRFPKLKFPKGDIEGAGKKTARSLADAIIAGFAAIAGGLIGKFVGGLVAAALGLSVGWELLAGVIIGLIVSALINAFLKSSFGKKVMKAIWTGLKAAAGWLKKHWKALLVATIIGAIFSPALLIIAMIKFGPAILKGLWAALKFVARTLKKNWKDLLILMLTGPFGPVIVLFKHFGKQIIDGLWTGIKAAGRALAEFGKWIWHVLVDGFKDLFGISSPSSVFAGFGKDLITGLVNGIKAVLGLITDALGDLADGITGFFVGSGKWLFEKGKNILRGLWNGIKNVAKAVKDWFAKLPGNIWKWIGTAHDLEWKLIHKGGDILHGFLTGILNYSKKVKSWFVDLPANVIRWIGNVGGWLIDKGKAILEGLLHGIGNAATDVHAWFSGLAGNVLKWVGTVGNWLFDKGKAVLGGLFRGIRTVAGDVHVWFKNLPTVVLGWFKNTGHWLYDIGKDLIGGMLNGIKHAVTHDLKKYVTGIGHLIVSWKGPPRKDKQLLVGVGKLIMSGLVKGIHTGIAGVRAALSKTTDEITDGLDKQFVKSLKIPADISAQFKAADTARLRVATVNPQAFGAPSHVTYNDNSVTHLEAITTADPVEIQNQFAWKKMIKAK